MTRDDIIRMAREAQLSYGSDESPLPSVERFAALVAAYTLSNIDPSKLMSFQEGYAAGVAAEREACAQVCEEKSMVKGGEVFAARIRARGEQ